MSTPLAPPFLATLDEPTPCYGLAAFFDADADADDRATAKRACLNCPVMATCARWGLEHRERGVWGGLDDYDRNAMRRAKCGTDGAFYRHRGLGEYCEECWTARAGRTRVAQLERLRTEDHGNRALYDLERRLGVQHCSKCKAWMREHSARRRARSRTEPPESVPAPESVPVTVIGAQAGAQQLADVA